MNPVSASHLTHSLKPHDIGFCPWTLQYSSIDCVLLSYNAVFAACWISKYLNVEAVAEDFDVEAIAGVYVDGIFYLEAIADFEVWRGLLL